MVPPAAGKWRFQAAEERGDRKETNQTTKKRPEHPADRVRTSSCRRLPSRWGRMLVPRQRSPRPQRRLLPKPRVPLYPPILSAPLKLSTSESLPCSTRLSSWGHEAPGHAIVPACGLLGAHGAGSARPSRNRGLRHPVAGRQAPCVLSCRGTAMATRDRPPRCPLGALWERVRAHGAVGPRGGHGDSPRSMTAWEHVTPPSVSPGRGPCAGRPSTWPPRSSRAKATGGAWTGGRWAS